MAIILSYILKEEEIAEKSYYKEHALSDCVDFYFEECFVFILCLCVCEKERKFGWIVGIIWEEFGREKHDKIYCTKLV